MKNTKTLYDCNECKGKGTINVIKQTLALACSLSVKKCTACNKQYYIKQLQDLTQRLIPTMH